MSVEYANRGWVKEQAPLLLGFLLTSGACTRGDQNTGGAEGTGAERAGVVAAPPGIASSRPRPFPLEEPQLLPVSGASRSYSSDVPNAPSLAIGGQSTVFVSPPADDNVYALVDDDGDHRVDRVHVMARSLDISSWITRGDGVSSNAELSRALGIPGFEARRDHLPKPVIVLTDKLPARAHHGWRYVRFGAGRWLYITVRSNEQA